MKLFFKILTYAGLAVALPAEEKSAVSVASPTVTSVSIGSIPSSLFPNLAQAESAAPSATGGGDPFGWLEEAAEDVAKVVAGIGISVEVSKAAAAAAVSAATLVLANIGAASTSLAIADATTKAAAAAQAAGATALASAVIGAAATLVVATGLGIATQAAITYEVLADLYALIYNFIVSGGTVL